MYVFVYMYVCMYEQNVLYDMYVVNVIYVCMAYLMEDVSEPVEGELLGVIYHIQLSESFDACPEMLMNLHWKRAAYIHTFIHMYMHTYLHSYTYLNQ
jgi:hypothetical protein